VAGIDRELDVLHVAVVVLEQRDRRIELGVRRRHDLLHAPDRLGRARAGDDVLALRLHEELAVETPATRRRVTAETDTGRRMRVAVAENHLHHVRGGPRVGADAVLLAVHDRARRVPGTEHGGDGAHQLLAWVLRELAAGFAEIDRAESADDLVQRVDCERRQVPALDQLEVARERVTVDAVDDLAEHLDQPPVVVEQEAHVGRPRVLDHLVVDADVEDRLHHPRHRDRAAGAHRNEQRRGRVSEASPRPELERRDVAVDLRVELGSQPTAVGQCLAAGFGGDGEAVGHG
jgi:hypothetical protein